MKHDVIVIGGGHAGCEAAAAAARLGAKVALVTMEYANLGAMSCNPAIGGIGKGHLVREVDALGGIAAHCADAAAIHHRMLNRSKGPAVHGPRVQADRRRFQAAVQANVEDQERIEVHVGEVTALIIANCRVEGVSLADGRVLAGGAVVLATGTFLSARLHMGLSSAPGGRVAERAAGQLAEQLRSLGFVTSRLKTGTPPRLDGRTIDWSGLDLQPSDDEPWAMSPETPGRRLPQLACAMTRTNAQTHALIRAARDQSPLYAGLIDGRGPRYCPSIEDKVARFGDRDGHQVFLEPEALDDPLVYPNGVSTSLPEVVQAAFLRTMPGLEHVRVARLGYAVEYDFLDPRRLDRSLQTRGYHGLFLAGQINGTTGYEEAAAQGLVAGANAALFAGDGPPLILGRESSYIGVMIDDLVLQGVSEPYRMLTARAEFRLSLRADNAPTRLGEIADRAGLLSPSRQAWQQRRDRAREEALQLLRTPASPVQMRAAGGDSPAGMGALPIGDWLARGQDLSTMLQVCPQLHTVDRQILDELVTDIRYAPYQLRQGEEQRRLARDEGIPIPAMLHFADIPGLSHEMIERLHAACPANLAEVARIPGITPAAIVAVMVAARAA